MSAVAFLEIALATGVVTIAVQQLRIWALQDEVDDLDDECLDLTRLVIRVGREKAEAIEAGLLRGRAA